MGVSGAGGLGRGWFEGLEGWVWGHWGAGPRPQGLAAGGGHSPISETHMLRAVP